ncbi:MAG: rhomboid family intramembrane serine protease [Deltaproteobacteria bacterium]|nr:rhomboid family intramembrane serine protease [Deltaproteobacteria bacterium]
MFAWQLRAGTLTSAVLIEQGAKSLPHQVELGQWWRLVTASALHAGWTHLIPNLLYVLYVGWNVESLLGRTGTLLVVVGSAVASMIVSSVATPLPTVGASGVTFGLFGAAVALGWRYGEWLPPRTAARFGWSVFPFVVYFLAFGAMWSDWVDNFCHLGGLMAGGALGMTLPSAHVETPAESWRAPMRAAAAAGVLFGAGVLMPAAWGLDFIGTVSPGDPVEFPQAGYRLAPPRTWISEQADGAPSWRSPTGAARLTSSAWVEEHEPPSRASVKAAWVASLERGGAVVSPRDMALAPRMPESLEGCFTMEADLVVDGDLLRSLDLGCVRGAHVTTLQFVHPIEHWGAYKRVRQRAFTSLSLTETDAVRQARSALVEGDNSSRLALAATLARLGQREEAEGLLAELEVSEPDASEVLYWRLWLELHLGEGRALAADREQMAERMLLLEPDDLPFVALAFDVLLQRQRLERAREVLDHMRSRWPDRSLTKDRIARMAAAGG